MCVLFQSFVKPIVILVSVPPATLGISVSNAGQVFALEENNLLTQIGTIRLHIFANPTGLKAMGGNYYAPTVSSGPPQQRQPGVQGAGAIEQGYLERSHVATVDALVALIVYPLGAAPDTALAASVAADRELAYPVLMYALLPAGALGILVTGMAAAFMSTIDTHITWGSSYFVRDFYQRFIAPEADDAALVRAGRFGVVLMLVLALVFATWIDSIGAAWKFFTLMAAGAGIIAIVRWLWWRINAYSELTALITAALVTLTLGSIDGGRLIDDDYHVGLLIVVAISAAATAVATFATKPTPRATLREFYLRVRPIGAWGPVRSPDDPQAGVSFGRILASWFAASFGVFALLFGIGQLLLIHTLLGVGLVVSGAAAWGLALYWAGALTPSDSTGVEVTRPD